MDSQTLVETDIAEGAKLLQYLDAHEFGPASAFWFLEQESGEYRLVLVSRTLARDGRLRTYEKLQKLLAEAKSAIHIDRVTFLKPTDPLPKLLRTAIRTGPGIGSIRFSRSVINGVYIPDAYIYRSQ